MAITTRTAAKRIQPRLHEPKAKQKIKSNLKNKKRTPAESESESESKDNTASTDSDLEPVRLKKWCHVNNIDSEVDMIDVDLEPSEVAVEEEDAGGSEKAVDEEEVSVMTWRVVLCST